MHTFYADADQRDLFILGPSLKLDIFDIKVVVASSARALAVGMVSAIIWRVKPLFQPHAEVHGVLHRGHHLTTSLMSVVDPPRARSAHKCHHAHRDRQAALDQPLELAAGSFYFCTPAWSRHVRIAV